ncbi:peptidase M14 [Rubrobacter taiwanensis]|jgi:hypothetical protein|uniref:Peptidase M14 n=1 Tax=Rubrobacter taiwanensis TaxID=185139 RepID=A0A4R1BGX5_9ACTN|nr:peptidase M14 [Rubrobacter taiwanensis]
MGLDALARLKPLLGSLLAALFVAAAAIVAALLAPGSPAAAQSANAHCGTETGDTSSAGWTSHEQLKRQLAQIERASGGRVGVEVVGHSNRGREIFAATVGSGDQVALITSEIHGNEKTGTEALLSMLRYLGSSDSARAREIRENITLVAMPKMNPDAAELDRRGNDMSWQEVVERFPQLAGARPAWNYYTGRLQNDDYSQRPGFDVNRDFNPDLDYVPRPQDFPGSSSRPGWYITPEAQAVRDVYRDLLDRFGRVDVFVDLHHQGPCYRVGDEDGDYVTLSLSAQFVPDPRTPEGARYAEYADRYDFDFSRQLNVAAYDALQAMGSSPFKNVTLYPQGLDLPGTALGSFALNGSGTVLFEVRGQTWTYGQKQKGQLTRAVETGLYGILQSVADGSVREIDPERYHEIPQTAR